MLDQCLQLIVLVTPDWDHSNGQLYRFERRAHHPEWKMAAPAIVVSVGRKGLGWGRGAHPEMQRAEDPIKQEGDQKAPAGIFQLGPIFGYGEEKTYTGHRMPYLPISEELECVDDPVSAFYNQFVIRSRVAGVDWQTSEKMMHPLYGLGCVIAHNLHPIAPHFGSCIFMHKWSEKGGGTAGCTAMAENDLTELLHWLDHSKNPRIVQLPLHIYEREKTSWQLPNLNP